MRQILLFSTIALLAIISLIVWNKKENEPSKESSSSGQAAIGGAFELTDQNGKKTSSEAFRGKLMLVFFGFTHCPDMCPTGLATMTKAMESLGKDASKVAPIFITVDPERDTPEVIKSYLGAFYPSMVGLTGTVQQAEAVQKAYKVFSEKTASSGHDYMMNHSGYIYLMSKDGTYLTHFMHNSRDEEITDTIRRFF